MACSVDRAERHVLRIGEVAAQQPLLIGGSASTTFAGLLDAEQLHLRIPALSGSTRPRTSRR
jgi:hypothetical protein